MSEVRRECDDIIEELTRTILRGVTSSVGVDCNLARYTYTDYCRQVNSTEVIHTKTSLAAKTQYIEL